MLANLNLRYVAGLVGPHAGRAIVYSIVLSNSFNLLVNTVLKARGRSTGGGVALVCAAWVCSPRVVALRPTRPTPLPPGAGVGHP